MRNTVTGNTRASGLGSRHNAAENLLMKLCRSGCVLDRLEIATIGLGGGVLVTYTVSGTDAELEVFRRLTNGIQR